CLFLSRGRHTRATRDWSSGVCSSDLKGRKGVSVGYPKRLLETVDDVWVKSRMMSGLSSGEGLIWYVRDPTYKPGKEGEKDCTDELGRASCSERGVREGSGLLVTPTSS